MALFEKKGFTNTSIQDIVDQLNVTKGTFYYYFTSKESLLMTIHEQYIDFIVERQKKILDTPSSYTEKLQQMILALILDIETKGMEGRVFFREIRHLEEENNRMIRDKRKKFRLQIEQVIQKGIEALEFRSSLNPEMTAFAILGMTNYSYQWYKPDGETTPEDLVKIYVDLLLNGMR